MNVPPEYFAELVRIVRGMIGFGVVCGVDHTTGTVRVQAGDWVSGPLKVVQPAGSGAGCKEGSMPSLDEQVVYLIPGGGTFGAAIRGVPGLGDLPAGMAPGKRVFEFADGQILSYDENTSTLTASKPLTIVGDLKVTGSIEASGMLQGGVMKSLGVLNVEGALNVKGIVTGASEILSGGIGLITHQHPFSLVPPETPPPKTESSIPGVP